jgi:uroporphyrinogen decarboxylase
VIEGGKSSSYAATKRLMYSDPPAWEALMRKLSETVRRYLRAQVVAGAQAVQLFDSWVGALAPIDYEQFVLPHVQYILRDLEQTGVPVIHFGTGTGSLLELQQRAGGTVIGVDWRTPLDLAWARLGDGVAVQGNLEPLLLNAPRELLASRVSDVLARAAGKPGHIFNVGHGLLPETPPDAVHFVADLVHEQSAR